MIFQKYSDRLNKDKIVILIPFWSLKTNHTVRDNIFNIFLKKLPIDFGYIHYNYDCEILSSDPEETKNNFNEFLEYILTDLKNLNNKEIYIYAQSLGTLFANIITDKVNIKKVVLILPGANLANCVWKGSATRKIKQGIISRNFSLQDINEKWKGISPDSYFKDRSKNTKFYILLARYDRVIPSSDGIDFVNLLNKQKIDFKLTRTILPHQLALVQESLSPERSIKFLTSN